MTTTKKEPKAGFSTSEFMLSFAVLFCATVLLGFDKIDQDTWKWVVSIVTGGYAIARAITKAGK